MSHNQKKESEDDCVRKVKNEVENVGVNISDMNIDRAHRKMMTMVEKPKDR